MISDDFLTIGGKKIKNRFFLGTGKFGSKRIMLQTIKQCGAEVVTVALRRIDADKNPENITQYIPKDTILMINTSGARNAEEAVKIARIAREALNIDWVKIEVINDSKYLLPDNNETVKSTKILADEGFTVHASGPLYSQGVTEGGGSRCNAFRLPHRQRRGIKGQKIY